MFNIKKVLTTTKRTTTKKKVTKVVKKEKKLYVDNYIIESGVDVELNDLNHSLIKDYLSNCDTETIKFVENWYIMKCNVTSTGIDITDFTGMRLVIKDKGTRKNYILYSVKGVVLLNCMI